MWICLININPHREKSHFIQWQISNTYFSLFLGRGVCFIVKSCAQTPRLPVWARFLAHLGTLFKDKVRPLSGWQLTQRAPKDPACRDQQLLVSQLSLSTEVSTSGQQPSLPQRTASDARELRASHPPILNVLPRYCKGKQGCKKIGARCNRLKVHRTFTDQRSLQSQHRREHAALPTISKFRAVVRRKSSALWRARV